jgi:chromate transport protein ChrA
MRIRNLCIILLSVIIALNQLTNNTIMKSTLTHLKIAVVTVIITLLCQSQLKGQLFRSVIKI